jgi:hypothetical protein
MGHRKQNWYKVASVSTLKYTTCNTSRSGFFDEAVRKNEDVVWRKYGGIHVIRYSRRSPGWVKRYHPHMEGSASRRKPHKLPSASISMSYGCLFHEPVLTFIKCRLVLMTEMRFVCSNMRSITLVEICEIDLSTQ